MCLTLANDDLAGGQPPLAVVLPQAEQLSTVGALRWKPDWRDAVHPRQSETISEVSRFQSIVSVLSSLRAGISTEITSSPRTIGRSPDFVPLSTAFPA